MHKRTGLEKLSKITWVGCNGTWDIHKKKRFHRLYNQFGLCCLCSLHALLKAKLLKRFSFPLVKILIQIQIEDLDNREREGWVMEQLYFPNSQTSIYPVLAKEHLEIPGSLLPQLWGLILPEQSGLCCPGKVRHQGDAKTLGSQELSWIRLVFHLGTPKITFFCKRITQGCTPTSQIGFIWPGSGSEEVITACQKLPPCPADVMNSW